MKTAENSGNYAIFVFHHSSGHIMDDILLMTQICICGSEHVNQAKLLMSYNGLKSLAKAIEKLAVFLINCARSNKDFLSS